MAAFVVTDGLKQLIGQKEKPVVFKIEEGYILSPAVYENASCFRYALPTEGESA